MIKEEKFRMNKTTLVIMAAGLGSRFGGIKQLEPVGPSGEIILDYSVYDAIEAGFNKVIFIIRKDIEEDFKQIIGSRIKDKIEIEYIIQDIDDLPEGYTKPAERVKPWGTGHAILSCIDALHEPFVVINADDYYGKEAFVKVNHFLEKAVATDKRYNFCMAGFRLGNTLSDHGTVTRGVCQVNSENILVNIEETHEIAKRGNFAVAAKGEKEIVLPLDTPVSMNMWGFTPDFLIELRDRFANFLNSIEGNELKAEYLLPQIVDNLIKEGKAQVSVLDTADKWFGVTYKEDKEIVVKSFQKLVDEGVYPEKLF